MSTALNPLQSVKPLASVLGIAALACGDPSGPGNEELTVRLETEHYVFLSAPGDHVDSEWQERYHAWLLTALEIHQTQHVEYRKYRNNAQKGQLTGEPGNSHAEPDLYLLHTVWASHNHEVVHVIFNKEYGGSPPLFQEGIAVAHQMDPDRSLTVPYWSGRPLDGIARDHLAAGSLPPLNAMIDGQGFWSFDATLTYPLAGSFVGFLINQSGLDTFKRFQAASEWFDDASTTRANFRDSFGEDVDVWWERWLTYLATP